MKITHIVAFTLPLLVSGCKRESHPVQTQPPPPNQATTVSNGGFSFKIGEIVMNGTNATLSNVTFTASQRTNLPPVKIEVSK